ncbi:MAG: hypothetical protein IPJ83_14725 [Saprospiraceae bacterium]|nr:hypothetical protein [Candidatus Vicinibacter proximus]
MVQSKSLSKDLNQLGGLEAFCKGNIQILTSSNSYDEQSRYISLFNCNEEEYGGQQQGLKQFQPVNGYPNPTDGVFLFNTGFVTDLVECPISFSIYDSYSNKHQLKIVQVQDDLYKLQVDRLLPGLYFIDCLQGKERKLIKFQVIR